MSDATHAPPPPGKVRGAGVPGDLERARAQIAALEQLLEVHEQTSLEQATRLEVSLREKEELLERERAARRDLEAMQQTLRDREEEFRTMANSIPQLAWMAHADGYIFWYNRRWYEYTGTTAEDMAGWGWQSVHDPEILPRVVERWKRSIATGESFDMEFPLRSADGHFRWFLTRVVPVKDTGGHVVRWFGTNTDVTERLELEAERDRALVEAKLERERLYSVFMQTPAAIEVTEGPDHVVVVQNELSRRLAGGRDMIGRRARDAFPEPEMQRFFDLLDRVYATGQPFVGHAMSAQWDRDGDGELEQGYFDFAYQPLKNVEGQVFGVMTHAVEVTEQVLARQQVEQKAEELTRLAQALERSNRDLDQFAYIASHDLKAPLRGIANLTQWIEEDLGDAVTGESKEHMQLLKGRVHRMEALIDGILAYSRAGRIREKPDQVDVGALLAETIELLAPPPGVDVIVAPGMPTLETERVPLQQVFMNLIGNAIKYNQRPGARVEIGVREGQGFHEFSVADNGPGIAPQHHERIWQIFQTLAARDKVEGTGIGLSVVRKLVEARGGRTWLESDVGRGTTFYFTWPLQPRTAP